ncbi:MAG: guanine deaminase [Candidatus Bathyarchaeia archaeon]
MKIYRGRIYNPLDETSFEDIPDGALVVNQDGRITEHGPWEECGRKYVESNKETKVKYFSNRILMPGLIDTHTHLPQFDCMGRSGFHLQDWLNNFVFPAEEKLEDPAVAQDTATRFFAALLRSGTTTAMIFSSNFEEATDIAFEEAARVGIRAIIGKTMMDRKSPPKLTNGTEQSIKESMRLCEKWHNTHGGRLLYAFSPRFAISCSFELMHLVGKVAKQTIRGCRPYIQTHLSENEDEVKEVHRLFPKIKSYTDVYKEAGLLRERTIVAHAIHLTNEEHQILSTTGTSVAHCPSSNFFLKSGNMDLHTMRRHNIKVGLGTDIGAGPDTCMFTVMKDAYYASKDTSVAVSFLLYLATLGGARALGLDDRIGNFQQEKEADFIVINPRNDQLEAIAPNSDIDKLLSFLIFRADDRVIEKVYVAGRDVYTKEITQE